MSTKIKLFLILALALLIRSWKLNILPSLNPDEAALGYNAYSLLQTGRDEHGEPWPIHFKSFGDYKPGGYVYLSLPFIKVFGLTPLSVRLPNLLFSILTIYLIFKLIFLLTKSASLSLLSSLILTLSPWHIHFSRGAWESNTALFFILLGIYWFYSFIVHHLTRFLYLFPLPLVIALYTYHSSRLLIPVLFVTLIIINFKIFLNKNAVYSFLLAFLLILPLIISFINIGTTRFSGVGLFADKGPLSRSEELLNQHPNFSYFDRIIHNQRLLYFLSWGQKYLSHFDLNFLFLSGDEVPRSKSPEMGQLYIFELPLIILGILYLINSKYLHLKLLIFSLLFVSPLAASLTFQSPSALRSLPLIIPLSIFVSLGLYSLKNFKYIKPILLIFYLISFIYYAGAYFVHSPQRYPFAWNTGFSEVIPLVESQKNNFSNIYFTSQYDQPYILYLFFAKYPPQILQTQIKLTPPDNFGFSTVSKIDNITFSIPDIIPPDSLVVDSSDFQITGQSFKLYVK
jgi:4-amino-4-deoxy-L-arabinose transferase-like glycosyltransferase